MIRRWYTALGINLLLGIPAIVPMLMLWILLSNWPLADIGLTTRMPNNEQDDSPTAALLFFGPLIAASAALWWIANRPLARRTHLTAPRYWLLSLAGTLIPTAVATTVWL
ncbi:hypothetical protein [Streptomyces spectabilis]|uniref:DUF4328 domain-containing protein n=1 Tax=Streptomyces spectabilis TaxID=68270 RepID=A0A7W8B2G6_STRST|nr:hypothetical protein [Streptomyces spectabilis]MBB5109144.1 hypothetical protein [Streptomyces spectabilis]MCI3907686.1 hypothetical protein [Streptomyces spectabilis]MCI3907706.1 hypothetical protein [Streptomyces spectabilis]GGV51093.1 hypothetical protein GCM10010245_80350 [Streptomyces spectabilis]